MDAARGPRAKERPGQRKQKTGEKLALFTRFPFYCRLICISSPAAEMALRIAPTSSCSSY